MNKYLVLAALFSVSACAHGPIIGDEDCTYDTTPKKNYRVEEAQPAPVPAPVVVQQPTPVYVQQPAPIVVRQAPCIQPAPVVEAAPIVVRDAEPCNGCQPTVRTTREPVEVIYKKVTYTTTYEPKTTSDVSYEREAVRGTPQEVRVQPVVKEVIVQKPAVKEVIVQKPAVKEVIVQKPVVSKVIETQVTQEPVKISVEEVK